MKRTVIFVLLMGLTVVLAACGNDKSKSAGKEVTSPDLSVAESVDDEESNQRKDSSESGEKQSLPEEDSSISTENVPSVVLSDFENAAEAVTELTGGSFKEEEVCYETYSYSDDIGTFRWDGRGLDIRLAANSTTGFFWTIEQFGEKSSFNLTTDEYTSNQTESTGEPVVGAGGEQHYYLTPNLRGGDALVLDYSRQNSDGTRAPEVVYLLYAHADEGNDITFSIRKYTTTGQ